MGPVNNRGAGSWNWGSACALGGWPIRKHALFVMDGPCTSLVTTGLISLSLSLDRPTEGEAFPCAGIILIRFDGFCALSDGALAARNIMRARERGRTPNVSPAI